MTTVPQGSQAALLTIENLETSGDNGFRLLVPNYSLSFGDTLAIVGANGSGKSSFIESILGLRARVTGTVQLFGTDLSSSTKNADNLKRIGVQLQSVCYSENFKVREIVDLHQMMYRHVDSSVGTMLGIDELSKHAYGKLSRGQKQRVDLYVALAHQPELLILDEPSTGLDQGFKLNFSKMLQQRLNNPKTATIICSHTSEEVTLCNRVLWLKAGSVRHMIDRGNDVNQLQALVACKFRLKIEADNFEHIVSLLEKYKNSLEYEKMDSRSLVIYGFDDLLPLETELRALPYVKEFEKYEADNSDFLRIVTVDSERKIATTPAT